MIEEQQATVFFAPTAGRRFFSPNAAIKAEARARIRKFCNSLDGGQNDDGPYYYWLKDGANRTTWFRWYDRLCWVLRAKWDVSQGKEPKPYTRKQRWIIGPDDQPTLDPPTPAREGDDLPF